MVVVKTVKEFYEKNHNELRSFMMYKTGIGDADLINDTLQEFYLRMVQCNVLEAYDAHLAPNEKENRQNFESWICYRLCWVFGIMKKRTQKEDLYNTISQVEKLEDGSSEPMDIWEVVDTTKKNKYFTIDGHYHVSQIEQEEEADVNKHLNAFARHIERTLPEDKSEKIKNYMSYKVQGLNSVDIGSIMNISNTAVNMIRDDAKLRYEQWRRRQVAI